MPNIEIHGYRLDDPKQREEANEMADKVWGALYGAEYARESGNVVVTPVSSSPRDDIDRHQPYFRIYSTSMAEREDIIKRLDLLDVDFEIPPLLEKFIERRSLRGQKTDDGDTRGPQGRPFGSER
jgi:hypothetical protein